MKKGIIVLLFFSLVGVGWFLFPKQQPAVSPLDPAVKGVTTVESSPIYKVDASLVPATLKIQKLQIDAEVEEVGLTRERAMDVPREEMNVAWFEPGFEPGQKGNAVIAGHFDKKNGDPSVFYNLKELEKGDEIEVEDKDGNKLVFEVTGSTIYANAEFPVQEIFGASNESRLNLITCEGTFDKESAMYSERLVVFSRLKSS